jgi:hypothetical protein
MSTRLPYLIAFALLILTAGGQALAQGYTCSTEAGGPCMSPLGPVGPQVHVPGPAGHGRTQADASADAIKVCSQTLLCCKVTHCVPGDPCGACSKKLVAALRYAARFAQLAKMHAQSALQADDVCAVKNKCPKTSTFKTGVEGCVGLADMAVATCLINLLGQK